MIWPHGESYNIHDFVQKYATWPEEIGNRHVWHNEYRERAKGCVGDGVENWLPPGPAQMGNAIT